MRIVAPRSHPFASWRQVTRRPGMERLAAQDYTNNPRSTVVDSPIYLTYAQGNRLPSWRAARAPDADPYKGKAPANQTASSQQSVLRSLQQSGKQVNPTGQAYPLTTLQQMRLLTEQPGYVDSVASLGSAYYAG